MPSRSRQAALVGAGAMVGAGALSIVSTCGRAYLAPSSGFLQQNVAGTRVESHTKTATIPDIMPSASGKLALTVGAFAGLAISGTIGKRTCKMNRPAVVSMKAVETIGNGQFTFDSQELLGSGAYGKVYKCKDAQGRERALKHVFAGGLEALNAEIEVYEHVGQHENICSFIAAFDREGVQDKYIIMELAKGGELTDLIQAGGKLTEAKSKYIFKQVVAAVAHMHRRNVLHRDLKTDNILLCTDSSHDSEHPLVKLIDFGAAHWSKDGPLEASKFIGSIQTIAPEVIISRGDDFDASDAGQIAETIEVEFKKRPFGIRKYRPGPGGIGAKVKLVGEKPRYPGDPLGQAFMAGVKEEWAVKSVNGTDVSKMTMDDIIDTMGDRLLDNSSRGAFDGSFAVTGDNKGKGKVMPKVEAVELPVTVQYVQMKPKPYGASADVWSLGSILYNMVAGEPPFEPSEESVAKGQFKQPVGVSAQLNDLLGKMLVVDPRARISLSDVASHPWLQ